MSRVTRGTASGEAYLDLQNQARRAGRPTQELLQLYALEGFLARMAVSDVRESFVLKGGVLLAAYDSRRPTKDVDLAGLDLANDMDTVLSLVRLILAVAPPEQDGITFAADAGTAEVIRDEDVYSGVRVNVDARLASANLSFHIDVNVGDPIWPEPVTVSLPRLRGGEPIEVAAYPLHMVHAEKIVTAVQRGIANTRWRNFGDVWSLSRLHSLLADDLRTAASEVARHRGIALRPLVEVLDGFAPLADARWSQWRRRNHSDHLPESIAPVLRDVIDFADPALAGAVAGKAWDPYEGSWR